MISRSKHRSSVELCADCGASGQEIALITVSIVDSMRCSCANVLFFIADPSWASINRGLLLCAECCSIHRSMGRHISHVKSLRQGTWPPSLLAVRNSTIQQTGCSTIQKQPEVMQEINGSCYHVCSVGNHNHLSLYD